MVYLEVSCLGAATQLDWLLALSCIYLCIVYCKEVASYSVGNISLSLSLWDII
jgi:hypothetical protein